MRNDEFCTSNNAEDEAPPAEATPEEPAADEPADPVADYKELLEGQGEYAEAYDFFTTSMLWTVMLLRWCSLCT